MVETGSSLMNDFGVLNNRKRALVALIHSVIFLGIAGHGFAAPKAGIVHGSIATGDVALDCHLPGRRLDFGLARKHLAMR